MRVIDADQVRVRADLPGLIESLERAFRSDAVVPQRLIQSLPGGNGGRQFLVMPAFDPDGSAAVKLVTYIPGNAGRGLPTVQAAVVAFSREGTPVAVLDGTMVTRIRTAASSALASKYLSRADSSRLTVVGTGALAPWMAAAHAVMRPIGHIDVWGRRAERVAATIGARGPGRHAILAGQRMLTPASHVMSAFPRKRFPHGRLSASTTRRPRRSRAPLRSSA